MGDVGHDQPELVSTLPETVLEDVDAPPGVLEAVELYESAARHYAQASSAYVLDVEVTSGTSAVSPW